MRLISVITTLYFGKKYLDKLLDMMTTNNKNLNKIGWKLEYVVVNDSPDDVINWNLIKGFQFDINIIEPGCNLGIHRARVRGLKQAKGEYVLFLDQDDIIVDNYLAEQLKAIRGYDYVVCNAYNQKRNVKIMMYDKKWKMSLIKNRLWSYVGCINIVSPGQVLIKRKAIPREWKVNIMHSNCADDYYLWILLLEKGAKITLNNKVLYTHIDTGNNLSDNKMNMRVSNLEMISLLKKNRSAPRLLIWLCERRNLYEIWLLNQECNNIIRFNIKYPEGYIVKLIKKYIL